MTAPIKGYYLAANPERRIRLPQVIPMTEDRRHIESGKPFHATRANVGSFSIDFWIYVHSLTSIATVLSCQLRSTTDSPTWSSSGVNFHLRPTAGEGWAFHMPDTDSRTSIRVIAGIVFIGQWVHI